MAKAAQFDESFVGEKPDMAPSLAHLNLNKELNASTTSLSKRSMVLDEERFEEQFLRCFVCKDRFENDSLPRLLPCHHSFCQSCILEMYRTASEQRHSFQASIRAISAPMSAVNISCPICRANYVATVDSIRKLPSDHRVVQLMDFVHHTDHYTVTFCSKHNLQPLNFFCESCIRPVCRDCTVLDHKDVDNHVVMDLEEALAKYTPVLDNTITEIDAEGVSLEEKQAALGDVTANISKVEADLMEQVKTCMSRIRATLNEREKTLETKVHQETEKERTKLLEKAEVLAGRRRTLKAQADRLRKAKEESNVEEMFRIHQEVREYRAGPPARIREVDDGLMTSFVLNIRDEAMLTSRINNFGDVLSKMETVPSRGKSSGKPYVYRSSSFR